MSLYADYLKEKSTDQIYEIDEGFATYRFLNDYRSVYIIDIYVRPEFRKSGIGKKIVDEIVYISKAHGCVELLGTIAPEMPGSTNSMKMQLAIGMKLHSVVGGAIILRKDI